MAQTIFYSWQSDTPSKTNRTFIRDSIERAINLIANGISIEEASREEPLRLDQDTQGIPGNPEIANTILQKIEICEIFVPDLTFAAHTEEGKGIPNPNVMLELGYAMQSIGSTRIVSVMNEAFGKAKDGLPFDLAHRRWPIRYTLSTDASPEIRKKVREELVSDLVSAIRNIVENEEDISLQAYKRQALSELTSVPHTHWKIAYMALYPGNFIKTGYSGGDVWDLFINVPQHEYSEAEWKKYLPLFHQIIAQMCDRLEHLMILHSRVLPTSVKVAITGATGNLRMQRALYIAMPKINNEHGGGGDLLGFDMRFKDVSKTLSAFIRTVDSARKSL